MSGKYGTEQPMEAKFALQYWIFTLPLTDDEQCLPGRAIFRIYNPEPAFNTFQASRIFIAGLAVVQRQRSDTAGMLSCSPVNG